MSPFCGLYGLIRSLKPIAKIWAETENKIIAPVEGHL
jgi:hypothetical protein